MLFPETENKTYLFLDQYNKNNKNVLVFICFYSKKDLREKNRNKCMIMMQ